MLTAEDISHLASFHVDGVHDVSLATSGDYFCVQKYGYHHIARTADLSVMKANPKSVASVCIAASTCAVADAVATAAMTFDSVPNAVQFCAALCEKHPRIIYGYCVMGRDGDVRSSSASLFEPVAGESEKPAKHPDQVQSDVKPVSSAVLHKLRNRIFVGRAVVVRGDRSENLDSLASLSLSPEQLVSFQTTHSFASGDDRACECFILYDEFPVGAASKGIALDLFIKDVYDVDGDGAIVVARIEKIRLGNVHSVKVVHGDAVLAEKNLKLSCVRSKFDLVPLVDQCKDVFRNYASMIWVVSTASVEDQLFALTATSVSITECMKDVVCFNVLHTSTFYANFGGVGSQVRLYALSSGMRDLASKYTGQSDVDDLDAKRLGLESLASVEGSVVMVNDVQDHHVVAVRISNVSLNDGVGPPLVWLQGDFV
ncbi:Flavin transferase ApbE [Gracilaria domingensis]|nr:Flavin transferase ApbE [Gracilaria domingensis]